MVIWPDRLAYVYCEPVNCGALASEIVVKLFEYKSLVVVLVLVPSDVVVVAAPAVAAARQSSQSDVGNILFL